MNSGAGGFRRAGDRAGGAVGVRRPEVFYSWPKIATRLECSVFQTLEVGACVAGVRPQFF